MALTLAARAGDLIVIGSPSVRVASLDSRSEATLTRDDGQHLKLNTSRAVEIIPNVYAQVGKKVSGQFIRLVFDAPRNVKIFRSALLPPRTCN
jgi:sRNA-binding carbon storage regulator CsrA